MIKIAKLLMFGSISSVIAITALAQAPHQHHGNAQDFSSAMAKVNESMMHDMMMPQASGNPDRDFVASMIPHHQGAIEMAKLVVEYGQDPEVRRLALEIVKAQEAEIAQMKEILNRLPR